MKKLTSILMVCVFILTAIGCGMDDIMNLYNPPELLPTTAPTAIPAPEQVQSTSTPAPTKPPETLPPISTPQPIIIDGDLSEGIMGDSLSGSETLYNSTLVLYQKAVNENWNPDTCRNNDVNYLVGMVQDKNNIGFCLKDIDGDGTAELFIGYKGYAEIYAMYTIVNNSVKQIINAGERSSYYLEPDFAIVNSASNSAFQHGYIIYLFKNHGLELYCAMISDSSANEQEPWFLAYDMDWNVANDRKMSNKTAESTVKAYEDNYVYLDYTSFAN